MTKKILLVDDERDIIEFMQYNLEQSGFEVITAFDGAEALEKVKEMPNLIVLDIMMPKVNGYEVCRRLRKSPEFMKIPIIFLSAKTKEIDELHGLEIGADDFIQKPISPKKLIARVNSNLRRNEEEPEQIIIEAGPLRIDREKYLVFLNDEEIIYPKKEFAILSHLAGKPGKVFTREQILADIWGDNIFVIDRTVDVHVRKIREKLGDYSDLIETFKGVGYRFRVHKQ